MLQKAAYVFGAVFVLVGLLGFVPSLAPKDDMGMPVLLGLFMVGVVHNLIHLLTGVAALAGASQGEKYSKLYFQLFGAVYALVTIVGFVQKDTVLGLIHVNMADNFLHLAIAVVALGLGFGLSAGNRTTSA